VRKVECLTSFRPEAVIGSLEKKGGGLGGGGCWGGSRVLEKSVSGQAVPSKEGARKYMKEGGEAQTRYGRDEMRKAEL